MNFNNWIATEYHSFLISGVSQKKKCIIIIEICVRKLECFFFCPFLSNDVYQWSSFISVGVNFVRKFVTSNEHLDEFSVLTWMDGYTHAIPRNNVREENIAIKSADNICCECFAKRRHSHLHSRGFRHNSS